MSPVDLRKKNICEDTQGREVSEVSEEEQEVECAKVREFRENLRRYLEYDFYKLFFLTLVISIHHDHNYCMHFSFAGKYTY